MTQNLCTSYLLELHSAIHDWLTDQFMLALYQAAYPLDPTVVTSYANGAPAGEIGANGAYALGGVALTVTPGYPKIDANRAAQILITFNNLAITPLSTIATPPQYGLIYNASKQNRAVATLDFGTPYVSTTELDITWPTPGGLNSSAIIRLGA